MAHQLYKKVEYFIAGENQGTVNQLEGRFSFINQVAKYNNKRDSEPHRFVHLKRT